MRTSASYTDGLTRRHATSVTWTVEAVKQVRYHVVEATGLFEPENTLLLSGCGDVPLRAGDRRLVVIDSTVQKLHGQRITRYFDHHGIAVTLVPLDAGESAKRWSLVTDVVDAMNDFGIDRRREPVIAIGGGVLLDVVGLAASLYRRGTPYVRIPTTLVGLVDAGVGVKTGVNYGQGKNRLGTYAPAVATFVDRSFLATLDPRHLSNGLAEILKMALIKSEELFGLLEDFGPLLIEDRFQGSTPALETAARRVVSEAIHLMLEELQPNLWETVLERCVDYGHSFSPTVEMEALPELLHGEAVAVDVALTTVLGRMRGDVTERQAQRVLELMDGLRLPLWTEVLARPGILDGALADTVRHRDGEQRLPLPVGIGHHRFVNDITPEELDRALKELDSARRELGPDFGPAAGLVGAGEAA